MKMAAQQAQRFSLKMPVNCHPKKHKNKTKSWDFQCHFHTFTKPAHFPECRVFTWVGLCGLVIKQLVLATVTTRVETKQEMMYAHNI